MLKETSPTQTINTDANDFPELRQFIFHGLKAEDGQTLKINVQKVGGLDKIYKNISDNQGKKTETPSGALAIINAFAAYRQEFELDNGKKITKAPHLLIAGGFVRDVLLNKLPKDIDFATNLTAEEVKALIKDKVSIKKIETQGECFQVVRVILENNEEYEIATFRKDSELSDGRHPLSVKPAKYAGKDANRRDLTINALFYNPASGKVIDYVGGLDDIKNKKLRFVGDPDKRIAEDKLRMLRYARFLLKTGFSPDKKDLAAIQNNADDIKILPKERIKDELDKMLKISPTDNFLQTLDELNLLEKIMPEVKNLANCEQGPPYHLEGNVFKHTLMVCANLPKDSNSRLKWASIFHDIAKPETRAENIINGKTKVSFLQHDELGAKKIKPILRRLNFTVKEIKELEWLIANHQLFFNAICSRIKQADQSDADAQQKAWQKSINQIKSEIMENGEGLVRDLKNLAIADSLATICEPGLKERDEQIISTVFTNALMELKQAEARGINIKKLVNGDDVMAVFNIPAGKKVGQILKSFLDQLSTDENLKTIDTAEAAHQYALQKLQRLAGKN